MYVLFYPEMLKRIMYLYDRWYVTVLAMPDGIAIVVDSFILFCNVMQNLLNCMADGKPRMLQMEWLL